MKEAETEDRLPRQYNLIEQAANLFGKLLETKAALDRSAITAQLYKLETRLEGLELRLQSGLKRFGRSRLFLDGCARR